MNRINFLSKIPASLHTDRKRLLALLEEGLAKFEIINKIIEIKFVSEDEIQVLNKTYRNLDKPTDILSFPQSPAPGKYQILGTLVISDHSVIRKNESIEEVVKHGLLHLMGFDHDDPKKERDWEEAALIINCQL